MKKMIFIVVLSFSFFYAIEAQAQNSARQSNLDRIKQEAREMDNNENRIQNRMNEISRLLNGRNISYGSNRSVSREGQIKIREWREKNREIKLNQIKNLSEQNAREDDFLKILKRNKDMKKLLRDL